MAHNACARGLAHPSLLDDGSFPVSHGCEALEERLESAAAERWSPIVLEEHGCALTCRRSIFICMQMD